MAVDLVDQPGFVAGIGQENPDQVDDIVTADDQSGLVAAGIKFGEFLAQERQQQTDREGERAAGDQAGKLGDGILAIGARSQEGITLGFIENQIEAEHDKVIAHCRLQIEQALPQRAVFVAVEIGRAHV